LNLVASLAWARQQKRALDKSTGGKTPMKTKPKNAKIGKKMTAVEKLEPDWWQPQLDTPVGRVELDIRTRDEIRVRRAGWMELYAKLIKWPRPHCRDTRFGPPYLDKAARRAVYLTTHLDDVALTRRANGSWKPAESYRARRDREIAQMLAEAVNTWMMVEPAVKTDLLRRATALHKGLPPLWWGPGTACTQLADHLSADIESGVFDFDDAGHAHAVATRAAERLRGMIVEVQEIFYEVRQALAPTTEDKAAA
jgi:hypothetical protein